MVKRRGLKGGRFSARRKQETVLRLLRGEDLEVVSREGGVTAATLSGWHCCEPSGQRIGEDGVRRSHPTLSRLRTYSAVELPH